MHSPLSKKYIIALSSFGGLLEFYDFIIYALLAPYIATVFFPSTNRLISLILTFATFSISNFVRPFSGIVFGHLGDKYGRKNVFTLSMFLMFAATFTIGLVPSYESIGVVAPVIVLCLRIIQGVSLGGETPGAITYISEISPKKIGLSCGWLFFAMNGGYVLSALVYALLYVTLNINEIIAWGWRLPFLLGGILGFIVFILRRRFQESPLYKADTTPPKKIPIFIVLTKYPRACLIAMTVVAVLASLNILMVVFIPTYLVEVLHYTQASFIWKNLLAAILVALASLGMGWFSDHFNKRSLLLGICAFSISSSYAIFAMYSANMIWTPIMLGAILTGGISGLTPPLLANLFPTRIRYSGIALAYNTGVAIFGGIAPLMATTLIFYTSQPQAPSYYLMSTALLGMIGALMMKGKYCNQIGTTTAIQALETDTDNSL